MQRQLSSIQFYFDEFKVKFSLHGPIPSTLVERCPLARRDFTSLETLFERDTLKGRVKKLESMVKQLQDELAELWKPDGVMCRAGKICFEKESKELTI